MLFIWFYRIDGDHHDVLVSMVNSSCYQWNVVHPVGHGSVLVPGRTEPNGVDHEAAGVSCQGSDGEVEVGMPGGFSGGFGGGFGAGFSGFNGFSGGFMLFLFF